MWYGSDGRLRLGWRIPVLAVREVAGLPLGELATTGTGTVPTVRRHAVLEPQPEERGLPGVRVSEFRE